MAAALIALAVIGHSTGWHSLNCLSHIYTRGIDNAVRENVAGVDVLHEFLWNLSVAVSKSRVGQMYWDLADVLLDNEDGEPFRANASDQLEYLLDQERRQSGGGFIHQQQLGT